MSRSGPTTTNPLIRAPLTGESPGTSSSDYSSRGGQGRGRGTIPSATIPGRGKRGNMAPSTPYTRPTPSEYSASSQYQPQTTSQQSQPQQQHHVSFSLPSASQPSMNSTYSQQQQSQHQQLPGGTTGSGSSLTSLGLPTSISLGAGVGPGLAAAAASLGLQGIRPTTTSGGMMTSTATHGDMDDDMDDDEIGEDEFTEHDEKMNVEQKADLSLLIQCFGPDHLERLSRYRNVTIPKQAVRKLVTQTVNQSVSLHVAQIIGGFAKTFASEIVSKARQAQQARNETGSLTPDDMREAYRMYVEEAGKVGAAKPLRGKRLFAR